MTQSADLLLSLRGVHRTYLQGTNRVTALKAIDLDITRGDFTALQGPSGSGKSTLLNICGLLDRADRGRIRFCGQSIEQAAEARMTALRRTHIGFVFQSYNLLPVLSAWENIEYPLFLSGVPEPVRSRRVREMLQQVGLEQHAARRPDHLSGGQRQRVAIARALVHDPGLVIADEPTANLDTATAQQVIELMHGLGASRGTTFLIATHDPRMAARCDRVLSLTDGRLEHAGKLETTL